jgi:hypothetical protein
MSETWTDEEYYDDQYGDEYYDAGPPRTWSSLTLAITGCVGIIVGFACAACLGLALGLVLVPPPAAGSSGSVAQPATAQEWASELRRAGLEVDAPRNLARGRNELPAGSLSGVEFTLPSSCETCSGRVIIFAAAEDVPPMAEWLEGLGQYVYSRDNILIQIDGQVPPEVAAEYEAVLMQY